MDEGLHQPSVPERLRRLAVHLDTSITALAGTANSLRAIANELEAAGRKHQHLRGKRVRVTLDTPSGKAATIVTGILLGFGTDGEFEIMEADGTVHYCWPMLSIEEEVAEE